jgi:hypothetical protein
MAMPVFLPSNPALLYFYLAAAPIAPLLDWRLIGGVLLACVVPALFSPGIETIQAAKIPLVSVEASDRPLVKMFTAPTATRGQSRIPTRRLAPFIVAAIPFAQALGIAKLALANFQAIWVTLQNVAAVIAVDYYLWLCGRHDSPPKKQPLGAIRACDRPAHQEAAIRLCLDKLRRAITRPVTLQIITLAS